MTTKSSSVHLPGSAERLDTEDLSMARLESILPTWDRELRIMSRSYATPWCGPADLYQAGLIALWHCLRGYQPEKGSFDHYARRSMKRAIEREAVAATPMTFHARFFPFEGADTPRQDGGPPRSEVVSFETWIEACRVRTVADRVRSALDAIPARERQVLLLVDRDRVSQGEVAARLGVSQPRVSQLRARARSAARAALE